MGEDVLPTDVWIDGDGLIRRVELRVPYGLDVSSRVRLDFLDLGAAQDVAPPSGRVTDRTEDEIAFIRGDA